MNNVENFLTVKRVQQIRHIQKWAINKNKMHRIMDYGAQTDCIS